MFALFETLAEYALKNDEINTALGYPNARGTLRYAAESPMLTVDGKYPMQILPHVAHLFAGCAIVDTVEYPQEVEDELN
jgi:hypothetical protein